MEKAVAKMVSAGDYKARVAVADVYLSTSLERLRTMAHLLDADAPRPDAS